MITILPIGHEYTTTDSVIFRQGGHSFLVVLTFFLVPPQVLRLSAIFASNRFGSGVQSGETKRPMLEKNRQSSIINSHFLPPRSLPCPSPSMDLPSPLNALLP